MRKLILFDFDGTLADTFSLVVEAYQKNAPRLGLKQLLDPEVLRSRSAREVITRDLGIPLWKLPYYLYKGKQILRQEYEKIQLFPGIKKVVMGLQKGYHVGILTSNSKELVQAVLQKEGLQISLIFSETTVYRKDFSLRFLLYKHKLKAREIIYVGDEIRDVQACLAAGVPMIAVAWGFNTKESLIKAGAKYVVDTPQELVMVMAKLRGRRIDH